MGEKLTNNNIDDVFRNSIDAMETEPSENFWVNASENALFKSAQASKKVIARWKILAAVSIILLIGLSAYVVYVQKQLSGVKNQLVVIENKEASLALTIANIQPVVSNPSNIGSTENDVKQDKTGVRSSLKTEQPQVPAVEDKVVAYHTASAAIVSSASVHPKHNNHVKASSGFNASNSVIANSKNIATNNSDVVFKESLNPGSNKTNIDEITLAPAAITTASNDYLPVNSNVEGIIPSDIEPVPAYVRPEVKRNILSKLSVSLFYEPYLSDELFEDESSDIVTYNNVSGNEEEVNPFSVGLKAGYDISKHVSVIAGCTYYSFNVSVSPTTIYAQKQSDGDAGYSFQTSAGSVQCPYAGTPKVGDGLTISGEEKVSYVSIPLQVKYNFTPEKKIGIYVTAGLQANIVVMRKMDMQWQSFNWGGGNATEGINGNKKLYGSYYFAPGISYKILNNVEIFFEPSLQGSPAYTAVKGTPYFGMAGGLTYHF